MELKKKKVIEITQCDFCQEEAFGKCELCGKDVCKACARWICKKQYSPVFGGPFPSFGSNPYAPYPWEWTPEMQLCKDCTEKFKMSIAILAKRSSDNFERRTQEGEEMTKFNKKTKGKEKKIVEKLQEEFNPSARDPFQTTEEKERVKCLKEILRKKVSSPSLEEDEDEDYEEEE